jgi:hypothetical protein
MSSFPNSPKLVKAGLVLIDPASARVLRIISLQYNSDTLSRTLTAQTAGGSGNDRVEPMRFKGPAVETFKLEADLDATDQLEFPAQNPAAAQYGIGPQLALIESLLYPGASQLAAVDAQASAGTLEIAPMLAPLVLFVWGKNRIVPVKISEFSVTEEAFDAGLNPIRAKLSLSLRVMSTDDLGFGTKGGSLYMAYLQNREKLATRANAATFATLGIGGIA